MDHVDIIRTQWQQERPELDTLSMATVGRIRRLGLFFSREMEKTFRQFGLHGASFDVLASLLRSGPPYALSPSELIASTMVTSGTMTNRLDQLEKAGLIQRCQSEMDRRCFSIVLSDKGYHLISEVIDTHVQTLDKLTETLSKQEQDSLATLLRKLVLPFETDIETYLPPAKQKT